MTKADTKKLTEGIGRKLGSVEQRVFWIDVWMDSNHTFEGKQDLKAAYRLLAAAFRGIVCDCAYSGEHVRSTLQSRSDIYWWM